MDSFKDYVINLAAGLTGFVVALAWDHIRKWRRLRSVRQFWRPFIGGSPMVVIGRFKEFSKFEASGLVGIGDAAALTELLGHLRSLGIDSPRWDFADRLHGDALRSDLILLGGPDANTITRECVSRFPTSIRFGNPDRYQISIQDTVSRRSYSPQYDERTGEVSLDYGLMFSSPNPFDASKRLLIIAGSFGYGTWAGCRLAIKPEKLGDQSETLGADFECLFQTDIVYSTPQDIKLVTYRSLTSSNTSGAVIL